MVLGTAPLVSRGQVPDLLKKATKITTFKFMQVGGERVHTCQFVPD